jgi:CHAD domain-containing protein/HD superfamily phosphodiesterase
LPPRTVKRVKKTSGLRYWMQRVLEECDQVAAGFSADPVHDLRVALRRCRSMADGLMAIDPDPDWKAMKKAGRRLFQRLGDLRDIQIMMEWIEKLHPAKARADEASVARASMARALPSTSSGQALPALPPSAQNSVDARKADPAVEAQDHDTHDPVADALLQILHRREDEQKHEARAALEEFDRKQWRQWSKSLPARAAHIRPGSAVFRHLALERWTAARELHTRALRNRSQVGFHTLRIGIKRFRYIVENFLPAEHKLWSNDLKRMQDLLGEVHDLDVLWATALSCRVFPDENSRRRWHARILEERTKRIELYRRRMTGPNSLWQVWRAELPQGKQIQEIATLRMKLWAKVLDPDFAHSERVARLALELYDGLNSVGLLGSINGVGENANANADVRGSLLIAALLHDVGKSKGEKGHHKASLELIRAHGTPLGWKTEGMQRAAIVARFHCGALPTRSHKILRDLLPNEQKITIQLAAILRLANALDVSHDGHIRRVQVESGSGNSRRAAPPTCLTVAAEGYSARSDTARAVAAERYLLETLLRRPVLIRPMNTAPRVSGRTQVHSQS